DFPTPPVLRAQFAAVAKANRGLLFENPLTFLQEFGKLLLLVGDTVCDSRLVFSAGKGGGLLGELSIADNRNALIELHQGRGDHWNSLPKQRSTPGAPHKPSMFSALPLRPRRALGAKAVSAPSPGRTQPGGERKRPRPFVNKN